jgi:TusA-related sulfurtransferase
MQNSLRHFEPFRNIPNRNTNEDAVMDQSKMTVEPDAEIDITGEICPMTFVHTRLALDRLPPGAVLRVRLSGDEPRRNVPRTAMAQGHAVLADSTAADGVTTLLIRKA